jgi:hypothetical protein
MKSGETYVTVKSEGGLFPAEFLRKLAAGSNDIDFLTPESYYLAPGERINEAISRSWNRMVGVWSNFKNARKVLGEGDAGTMATRDGWMLILFQELGYGRLSKSTQIEIDGKQYPVSHIWKNVPIHIVGCNIDLDRRTAGVAGASKMSPFGMVQEFLNRSDNHLWGFVSNGIKLRVLRDNLALSRQACIDFDLEAMMESEAYSDFVILWLLCHQSRVDGARPELCILERWVRAAERQGIRVLEALRGGVEKAIEHLGAGFIAHPANLALREKLKAGTLKTADYYRQVLRLVYRLLFLFAAEDRDLLMLPAAGVSADDIRAARERYMKYYSTKRLRDMAAKLRGSRHTDLFRALQVVMNILCGSNNSIQMALPALGSFLWSQDSIADIVNCEIENRDFLDAVRSIGFTIDNKILRPIDYTKIDTEEFGSIFESLLELSPVINSDTATFELKTLSGNERKTTGSYYTPDSLVECLLETALDPVIKEALKKPEPAAALLALKVCDPACGSGHFLISAARRMANHLARVYSGDEEPSPDCCRKALRDIVGHCIYGVDLNPMAVELCKVNLWMEALEPGKPLSFLEHHIKCGNSLIGTTPKLLWGAPKKYINGKWVIYEGGIPDDAFNPIEGDDKKYCSELKKLNKAYQMNLFEKTGTVKSAANLSDKYENIDNSDDSDLAQIKEMSQKYSDFLNSFDYIHERIICDAWCSAFVWNKTKGACASPVPLTNSLLALIKDNFKNVDGAILNEINRLRDQYKFFHWHIEFPDVFRQPAAGGEAAAENEEMGWNGGFDCVLGNPPWEHTELKEKEFFANKNADIINAKTGAQRKKMIEALEKNDPLLYKHYIETLREHDGVSHFIRNSGYFPLCGCGRINTYAIFAELNRNIMGSKGHAGFIVPSGIATDDTTKFFFQSLVEKESLASLYDFENRQKLFQAVDSRMKFSLLTMTGLERPSKSGADFAFFLYQTEDLSDPEKVFKLSKEDIELINPNTKTCPIFRSKRDAEITKAIYRRVPVLIKEGTNGKPDENPWGISFKQGLFNMTSDSHLFRTREQLEGDGWKLKGNIFEKGDERYLPLYEAKMIHHYNHRWASSTTDDEREMDAEFYADPKNVVMPRYWVTEEEVEKQLNGKWDKKWLVGFRDITNTTNERTMISSLFNIVPVGHTMPLIFTDTGSSGISCFVSSLCSFSFDYVARQKVGGTHMTYGYLMQLPSFKPETYDQKCQWQSDAKISAWLFPRVLELVYTAYDLKPFALDCGYDGPPFKWDDERRFMIRCELDAAYFHLYEISRDDVDYIMDTFPITQRKDQDKHGFFRTKKVILEIYDEMAAAIKTGKAYQTRLEPPPGDARAGHEK